MTEHQEERPTDRRFGPGALAAAAAAIFLVVLFICAALVFAAEGVGQRVFGSVLLAGAVALIGAEPVLWVLTRLAGRRRVAGATSPPPGRSCRRAGCSGTRRCRPGRTGG
jgi:hypothetical protein